MLQAQSTLPRRSVLIYLYLSIYLPPTQHGAENKPKTASETDYFLQEDKIIQICAYFNHYTIKVMHLIVSILEMEEINYLYLYLYLYFVYSASARAGALPSLDGEA